MRKQKVVLPILALVLASILWGSNTVFIKVGVSSIPVPIFIASRFMVASIILLPLAIRTWRPIDLKGILLLSLSSLFYMGLSALALNIGLSKTSASNAAVIYLLEPLILLVLSASFLKERLSLRTFIGICTALAGSMIIIGKPWATGGNGTELTGNLLVAIAAFCFAISTLICKPLASKVSMEQLTFLSLFPGTIPVTVYVLTRLHGWDISTVTTASWRAWIASTIAVIFANLLFFFALNYKKALDTGVYQYLEAVTAIVVAWMLLAERPGLNFYIGSVLVFTGLYLSEFYKLRINN